MAAERGLGRELLQLLGRLRERAAEAELHRRWRARPAPRLRQRRLRGAAGLRQVRQRLEQPPEGLPPLRVHRRGRRQHADRGLRPAHDPPDHQLERLPEPRRGVPGRPRAAAFPCGALADRRRNPALRGPFQRRRRLRRHPGGELPLPMDGERHRQHAAHRRALLRLGRSGERLERQLARRSGQRQTRCARHAHLHLCRERAGDGRSGDAKPPSRRRSARCLPSAGSRLLRTRRRDRGIRHRHGTAADVRHRGSGGEAGRFHLPAQPRKRRPLLPLRHHLRRALGGCAAHPAAVLRPGQLGPRVSGRARFLRWRGERKRHLPLRGLRRGDDRLLPGHRRAGDAAHPHRRRGAPGRHGAQGGRFRRQHRSEHHQRRAPRLFGHAAGGLADLRVRQRHAVAPGLFAHPEPPQPAGNHRHHRAQPGGLEPLPRQRLSGAGHRGQPRCPLGVVLRHSRQPLRRLVPQDLRRPHRDRQGAGAE